MLAHAGGGVHRVPLIRRYTASEQEIEFWRRYLEIVFADLFDSRPTAGSWCVSGAKEFKRSIDARTTSFQSHYLKTLGQPGLLDEAAWHCARFRESLYQTTSFQAGFGQPSPLVPIADDRYWLLAGLSRGAPHDASGQLSLSTWDSTLQALVKMVWVDFLGWAVQLSNLPTLALEIVPSAVAAFGARFFGSEQPTDESWFGAKLPAAARAALMNPVGAMSSSELDRIVQDVLAEYPNDRARTVAGYRAIREEVMEIALGEALEALADFPFDEWTERYFREAPSRAKIEIEASQALRELLIECEYEVRNIAIDHREVPRADDSVLEYWATTAASLARDVLSAAIAAWHQGERSQEGLERRLRHAYDRLGFPLSQLR